LQNNFHKYALIFVIFLCATLQVNTNDTGKFMIMTVTYIPYRVV